MSSGGDRAPGDFRPLFVPVAYSLFHDSGTWPTVRAVHRRLVSEQRLDVPIREVVEFFRYKSGAQGPDALARLDVNAIHLLADADRDLKHVVSVVSLAVQAYWESESPEVTSSQAVEALGLTALEARRLYELLQAEYWLWRGSMATSDGSEWRFQV